MNKNRKKALFLLVNAILIVVLVWFIRQPGSRLVPLALLCFILSVVGFYYGFLKKDDSRLISLRYRTQAGAVIFFILAMGLAFWSRQEQSGIDVIAEWVTPYPNIKHIMLVPRVSDEFVWGWILESPDAPDKIVAFYQDAKNTQGWDVKQTGKIFFLTKKGFRILLIIGEKPEGARLYYQLMQLD